MFPTELETTNFDRERPMKGRPFLGPLLGSILLVGALIRPALAQSGVDLGQLLFSTNATPVHGLNWAPQPPAELPVPPGDPVATSGQFQGAIVFGGVARQGQTRDLPSTPDNQFKDIVASIDWPRSTASDGVTVRSILRGAVGAPYLGRQYDLLFGQVMTPPDTNVWHSVPVFWTGSTNDPTQATDYYWSPHASTVYASKIGQVAIAWRAKASEYTKEPGAPLVEGRDYVQIGSRYFGITNTTVLVSSVPIQKPRKIYWTKGAYQKTGVPVLIPTGVKRVKFAYNPTIPEWVSVSDVVVGGGIPPHPDDPGDYHAYTNAYGSTIMEEAAGFISAYNREGRILVELLGESTGSDTQRQIGIEIVDVVRDAIPDDVTIELGERVTAYPGNEPSAAGLQPSPVNQMGVNEFAYRRNTSADGDLELYATRVTRHLSDYQVHWLEEGVGGLRWPLRFVRYKFMWPTNIAQYSHYIRPEVGNEAEARLTGIRIPTQNAPFLEEQDPSNIDTPRAKLTGDSNFYTYLDRSQPVLRALLRYKVGDRVAFERVFSWLDGALREADFSDPASLPPLAREFSWEDESVAPRVVRAGAVVGRRLEAPSGELGGEPGTYLSGHISEAGGNAYSVNAYVDPLDQGFAAASASAIIPVNAIPGADPLEVWWFRRNASTSLRKDELGFLPTYWPAVLARYTVAWPDSEAPDTPTIVLASNDGSGPLDSYQVSGHLYVQNQRELPGYNPNEEHALLQGGRVWALRDDLNVRSGSYYSSEPYVLLEYQDEEDRPNMTAFRVVRETESSKFDYQVEAGSLLQPPMPLPLLDKPIPAAPPGKIPHSLNTELSLEGEEVAFPDGRAITFEDRKGNHWVLRGPHFDADPTATSRQFGFYYKTLPGFWFPTNALGFPLDSASAQPPVGTITPYLRDLEKGGDPISGSITNTVGEVVASGSALPITFNPHWPKNAPVLLMGETLTVPKRGLPAIRGQSSLEVIYQQSAHPADETDAKNSVVLYDPTAAKRYPLRDSRDEGLASLPPSIQTSTFEGRTFFPRLPPHLAERFYLDANESKNGSLILVGEFRGETLGESYLLPNILGSGDIAKLKELCSEGDDHRTAWDAAIDSLALQLETYIPNPGLPGEFHQDGNASKTILAGERADVTNSDEGVDSYALTAVGPGTGYVTLIAGNGEAFTPKEEPISVKVIRVVDALHRGEVKVINPSNPLGEMVTLQQTLDLAGNVAPFEFDWRIAAPVDGEPPPVYDNRGVNLLFAGSPSPWQHLRYPIPGDSAAEVNGLLTNDVSTAVVPVSVIPFSEVSPADGGQLSFVVDSEVAALLRPGSPVGIRSGLDDSPGVVGQINEVLGTGTTRVMVRSVDDSMSLPDANGIEGLYERRAEGQPQSIVFREFSVPSTNSYSQYYLSLDLDDALGARVYVDGALAVQANLNQDDTAGIKAPDGFSPAPLAKVYRLGPEFFSAGTTTDDTTIHRVAVELFSGAIPGTALGFDCQIDAYQSEDLVEQPGSNWIQLEPSRSPDKVRTVLGESADVRALSDNYVITRYRAKGDSSYPNASKQWSQWTDPAFVEGWIKRVLAGINPFNQRTTDLFNNTVNTDANILTSAGQRWEGDVALNLDTLNDYGLIEIYETVLRRGRGLSIDAGISYDPANDALLLAAGYLCDLYLLLGNEARSDAANPTIGIGSKDSTYGDIATALFAFKGQLPTLLEEELALLRGRDDFLQPGVRLAPVYNRLVWNYTRGIDAGEVIYALNYNILDQNRDGRVDAEDAAHLFPQGHGDAYGHYLTALKGYYSLLIDLDFTWVPRIEAVNILGKPVAVDYQDERKFAAAAAAVARTGRQVFDLTWRRDYQPGVDIGWAHFTETDVNPSQTPPTTRQWSLDHWAARTGQGAYLNWALGNSILPPDDTAHEGIQKVDRTTVPELRELAATGAELQSAMDSAEAHLTPLGLATGSLAFDVNPNQVTGPDPKPHFEQVYERALGALRNAVASFDDAKDVTRLLRSEQDSLAELQAAVTLQEQGYTNALIELYGTPYPEDIGPGGTYKQGYNGPDLFHYTYVEAETIEAPGIYTPNERDYVAKIDIQLWNASWSTAAGDWPPGDISEFLNIVSATNSNYTDALYIPYALGPHGFFDKPESWTSSRRSPGRIQQAISEVIRAHDGMYYALAGQCERDKKALDSAMGMLQLRVGTQLDIMAERANASGFESNIVAQQQALEKNAADLRVANTILQSIQDVITTLTRPPEWTGPLPKPQNIGGAIGVALVGVGKIYAAANGNDHVYDMISAVSTNLQELRKVKANLQGIENTYDLAAAITDLGAKVRAVQDNLQVVNERLRTLDDAERRYAALVAEGERLQQEREIFRQRSAALVQGFRTRDAAFRIFRNEKLERYQSLFDLSARYAYLAANAYDYETGLLNTQKGRDFVSRIVDSRALGVVRDGQPQFAGSNLGDPGLSSVLAEMKADWDVLRGRLGFNNPTAYGTTFSLRTEKHRVLPGDEGASAWKDVLNGARRANILEDADVKRLCMQVDLGNGLPLPGLVVEFETTIADGYNFFGQPQQGWDHYFDSSSFATKVFAVGVAFEGYVGMDDPVANSGSIRDAAGASPPDPSLAFLDPKALGATPGIYLIPVGLDSMRSPALGDAGNIRTWNVDDVTIPLPFNIGNSDFSSKALYQSTESLSEPLFATRKHASFRPVSTTEAFSGAIYGGNGALQRSQFTNTRLIGRSVWNSKWKLVIPGTKLLHDPEEGLNRFINTVKDIKLHLVTYSYAGN